MEIRLVSGCAIIKKIFKLKDAPTTIEELIGEKAVVVEKIHNVAGSGLVKVKGQLWAARAVDCDAIYEKYKVVSIVAIEGVKLVCK